MNEGPVTISLHVATLVGIFGVLGILLNQHKVWIRMKDRLNTLWKEHCKQTGEDFVRLDNGH